MYVLANSVYCLLFFEVDNWEVFEKVLDHTYSRHIRSESHLHPVMMSEPAVSSPITVKVVIHAWGKFMLVTL